MKKIKKRIIVRRKCDKCGITKGTTVKTKKYYCETCMKKYFEENYGKPVSVMNRVELAEKTNYGALTIATIVAFLLGLFLGKVI